jgi:hypothetical protein
MKTSISYIALFAYTLICLSCHHQLAPTAAVTSATEVTDLHGNPQLLGKVTLERLKQPPYGDWFNKNYDSYPVDSFTAGQLRTGLAGRRFIIFLGTWCGDSRREVPRFFKLMDCCGIDRSGIEIITVSNADSLYKQSSGHEEKGRDIFRVPAFIVLDKRREIGRIVESPVVSLEKDLLSITLGTPYTPHYQGGALLAGIFRREGVEKAKKHLPELAERLKSLVSSAGELASYAKVLQAAGEPEKANMVRSLNEQLFPAGK